MSNERESEICLPVSDEEVAVFHHGDIGRSTELRWSRTRLKHFADHQRRMRQIVRFEHEHLVHGDVRQPEIAGVIDGQAVRHVEHLRSPTIFALSRSSVDVEENVVFDRPERFVSKTKISVEISTKKDVRHSKRRSRRTYFPICAIHDEKRRDRRSFGSSPNHRFHPVRPATISSRATTRRTCINSLRKEKDTEVFLRPLSTAHARAHDD